jgi:hypothetical protein
MKWIFARLPRPMQRTFRDDLKWATAYLVGLVAGYLAFGRGHIGLLIGGLIGSRSRSSGGASPDASRADSSADLAPAVLNAV